MPDRAELETRVATLQSAIARAGLDGALILQRADLVYYAGAILQGALALPARGEARLFLWRGLGRLGETSPFEPVVLRGFTQLPAALGESPCGSWRRIGLEEDVLPVSTLRNLSLAAWSHAEFRDVSLLIRQQRSVKSETELTWVRDAGRALVTGFRAIPSIAREGMAEYELCAQMQVVMRRAGDQAGVRVRAFDGEAPGVVAYGPSAAVDIVFDGPLGHPGRSPYSPMGSGDRPLGRDCPLIVDVVAGVHGYTADMTRTYALGRLDKRFVEAHDFCVQVIEELARRMVPGAIPEELYLWAVAEADKAGFSDNFMNRGRNKVRFLGHGVGLELDELPVLAKRFTDPLRENMVVAIEPKIVFEDGAVGVEDTVIVKDYGAEVVTAFERPLIQIGG
ncbi:MAG: Xaa-Pro peptidase family protein [Planctomycetota bacterium]